MTINYPHKTNTLLINLQAIVLSLFCATCVIPAHAQNSDEAVKTNQNNLRQAKLKELKSSIEKLKSQLNEVKGTRNDLLNKLEKEEKKIGELNDKVENLQKELKDKQTRLETLREDRRNTQIAKTNQQKHVAQHVNAAYRLGKQSSVKLILNQTDPARVARNLKYFDYIIKDRAEQIESFSAAVTKLNKLEPEIAAEKASLSKSKTSFENKRLALIDSQDDRKRTLAKLESAIANKDKQLEALEQDRKHLEKLVQRVVRVVGEIDGPTNTQALSSLRGKLPWPVKGQIKHRFGSTRIAGKVKWQGTLISAKKGSNVKAVHHGRVVFSDYLRGYGLLVIVDHGRGFLSLYAHNQTLYKSLGEWVDTKDIIAAVGDTGGQNQSGLYFELRHKGSPTNPHKWLSKRT